MKKDNIMTQLTKKEADILDEAFESAHCDNDDQKNDAHKNRTQQLNTRQLNQQKEMALSKIHEELSQKEMSNNDKQSIDSEPTTTTRTTRRRWKKRTFLVLVAAAVLLVGNVVSAAVQQDWDLRFAEETGIGNGMQYLEGGYVLIGEVDKDNGVTVKVSQSIGDQNTQWIQIDTNVEWDAAGDESYGFDSWDLRVSRGDGIPTSGGYTAYSFYNEGFVSFILYAQDYKKINRSDMELAVSNLSKCSLSQNPDEPDVETMLVEGEWKFNWTNSYAANTITKHPMKFVSAEMEDGTPVTCFVTKIEVSPVSIRVESYKNPKKRGETNPYAITTLKFESITLKDGTNIPLQKGDSGGEKNGMKLNSYVSLSEIGTINPEEIDYVTIEGEEININ